MESIYEGIGKKIRDLRLSRGMTQKELAVGSVTRNMLSLIENGNALPSLSTLVELADRLGVSVGYFFAATEEEMSAFTKMSRIGEMRRLYREGEYSACLTACREIPCPDDDILLLSAECSLALAEDACRRYALSTALTHLTDVKKASLGTVGVLKSLYSTAVFMERLIECTTNASLPAEILNVSHFESARIPVEFFVYLQALARLDNEEDMDAHVLLRSGLILSPIYRGVVEAKILMLQGRHADAFTLLQNIASAEKPGFFTMFRLLNTLESCASTLGDFKNAYQYSTEKIKLLEQFTK